MGGGRYEPIELSTRCLYREKAYIIQQLNVVEKLHNELCFDFVLSNLKNNVDPLCVPNGH